jgi:membrane associated rhomboid family serine protease
VLKRFTPIITLTAICWLVWILNGLIWQGHLTQHGIVPRQLGGLAGIIWAPFLHASFRHLAANTLPLLILGGILCARSKTEFTVVTVAGILLGGILTWLFARNACHIGASGLIFCFFGYLASLALFRRTFGTFCLSVVCILAYGGMIRGILPASAGISWESHLAGLVAGIALGSLMSRWRKTPKASPNSPVVNAPER